MAEPIEVTIKHAGKSYQVTVNPSGEGAAFKDAVYQVTGIPSDRMKVIIKGQLLKDDTDLTKLGLKAGQVIGVIGTAGPLPEAPQKPVTFLEDMAASDLAATSRDPVGLINLGQTCYLNSSLQVLRTIPQLASLEGLVTAPTTPQNQLASSLKSLFNSMGQTTTALPPLVLLSTLRRVNPQFAEQDRTGGFSQQDADEAWTQLISALRASVPGTSGQSSVDEIMSIALETTQQCIEAPEEAVSTSSEKVLKLSCNIRAGTNFLMTGIMDSLDEDIERHSATLGVNATFRQQTRISRLPAFLAVHLVRFYWRRDIQKKAKIMRKVKFPLQLDASDMLTDGLRTRQKPLHNHVMQFMIDRDDRARENKKLGKKGDTSWVEEELEKRRQEQADYDKLTPINGGPWGAGDNPSGMYELCAMITHKGASADSGHYIGWARKEGSLVPSGEEEWHKFDDDKVSVVTADKILNLDGGGQDSVAYILLYRAAM